MYIWRIGHCNSMVSVATAMCGMVKQISYEFRILMSKKLGHAPITLIIVSELCLVAGSRCFVSKVR